MEIRLSHRFPCSPSAYWDYTREPAFEAQVRSEAEVDYALLESRDNGAHNFTRARVSPRKELPALAQKAMGQARLSYVQEIDADSEKFTTRWKVVSDFMSDKVRCQGSSRVVATPDGCERIIEGSIDVSVPIIGGQIEKQIVGEISRSYERAADVLRRFIQERRA
jgi:hypothetical protein